MYYKIYKQGQLEQFQVTWTCSEFTYILTMLTFYLSKDFKLWNKKKRNIDK